MVFLLWVCVQSATGLNLPLVEDRDIQGALVRNMCAFSLMGAHQQLATCRPVAEERGLAEIIQVLLPPVAGHSRRQFRPVYGVFAACKEILPFFAHFHFRAGSNFR